MLVEKALDISDNIYEYDCIKKSDYTSIHKIVSCVSTLANEVRNLQKINENLTNGSAFKELKTTNEVLSAELRIAFNKIKELESK
jgi:hypothetical protein